MYGIPEFRLPKDTVVKAEIENVKRAGCQDRMQCGHRESQLPLISSCRRKDFSAVFIGSGRWSAQIYGNPRRERQWRIFCQ